MQPDLKHYNLLIAAIAAAYHDVSSRLGLADSTSQILYTLCLTGDGCPLTDIVRLTGISKQTINSALRRLERDGVLYLAPDGSKKKTVHLTAEGLALRDRTAAHIVEAENAVFAAWPDEDTAQYLALTQRFLDQFREKTAQL